MIKNILALVIITFGIVMIIFMCIAIISGIFYCIYQKSNKKYFNIFLHFSDEQLYFTLHYKKKKIDDIFVYGKYKGHYYFVGMNGIYKLKKLRINKIQENELQGDENNFIFFMIKERMGMMKNNKDVIDSFISKYGDI